MPRPRHPSRDPPQQAEEEEGVGGPSPVNMSHWPRPTAWWSCVTTPSPAFVRPERDRRSLAEAGGAGQGAGDPRSRAPVGLAGIYGQVGQDVSTRGQPVAAVQSAHFWWNNPEETSSTIPKVSK
ncbi:unnamed protein product [Arctogadus glacialis]